MLAEEVDEGVCASAAVTRGSTGHGGGGEVIERREEREREERERMGRMNMGEAGRIGIKGSGAFESKVSIGGRSRCGTSGKQELHIPGRRSPRPTVTCIAALASACRTRHRRIPRKRRALEG